MKKIAFLGIGGIGGYYGGLMAQHYAKSNEVEIYFIARGENEREIRENGLRLETTNGKFLAHPYRISSDPAKIGIVDLLIVCTKSYELEQALYQYITCINNDTVILPLLNGVDSKERIQIILRDNEVWEGCVYVVSRVLKPGYIQETGIMAALYFGATDGNSEKLKQAEHFLKESGIDARLSENITLDIWQKFLFISSVSSLLTYLDTSIGAILANPEKKGILLALLHELKSIADAKDIQLPDDIIQKAIETMSALIRYCRLRTGSAVD